MPEVNDEVEVEEEEVDEQYEAESEAAAPTADSGIIEVTARDGKDGVPHSISYDFGKDVYDAIDKFGAQVVHTNFRSNAKVTLQSVIRRWIKAGKDLATLSGIWKPGVTMEKVVDVKAQAIAAFAVMDVDEKKAFIKSLQEA